MHSDTAHPQPHPAATCGPLSSTQLLEVRASGFFWVSSPLRVSILLWFSLSSSLSLSVLQSLIPSPLGLCPTPTPSLLALWVSALPGLCPLFFGYLYSLLVISVPLSLGLCPPFSPGLCPSLSLGLCLPLPESLFPSPWVSVLLSGPLPPPGGLSPPAPRALF